MAAVVAPMVIVPPVAPVATSAASVEATVIGLPPSTVTVSPAANKVSVTLIAVVEAAVTV